MSPFTVLSESVDAADPSSSRTEFSFSGQTSPMQVVKGKKVKASYWSISPTKRVFDLTITVLILGIFGLPMLVIALCIRLTSTGPALFTQQRVGLRGKLFTIYKFRSMEASTAGSQELGLTKAGDLRVTGFGRWLRKLKLDELPQFFNVLRGEMSLVGPRPKLPQFAEDFQMACRPGVTGAASLAFRCEEEILEGLKAHEVEIFYHQRIKPLKARIDRRYMSRATFRTDLEIITATFVGSLRPIRTPRLGRKPQARVKSADYGRDIKVVPAETHEIGGTTLPSAQLSSRADVSCL